MIYDPLEKKKIKFVKVITKNTE